MGFRSSATGHQQSVFPQKELSAVVPRRPHKHENTSGASGSHEKQQLPKQAGWLYNDEVQAIPPPVLSEGITGSVVQIAVGAKHGVILTDEGIVYTFGDNSYGQLGRDKLQVQEDTTPGVVPRICSCSVC